MLDGLQSKVNDLMGKVNGFQQDMKPVIEKVNNVVDTVQSIAGKVDNNIEVLETAVNKVKDTIDSIVEFEQSIQRRIEPPINDTINTYSAIVKGVMAFVDKFKNFRRSRIEESIYEEPSFVEEAARGFENEFQKEYDDINRELNEVREKLEEMRK
jgi:uncharacterized protein YoxC